VLEIVFSGEKQMEIAQPYIFLIILKRSQHNLKFDNHS